MNGQGLLHDGALALMVLATLGAISIIVRTLRNGVPPMPSSARVRAQMMSLVRQVELPRAATVVELGSGWGGLSPAVSRNQPTATVIGYENSAVPFLFSVVAGRLRRVYNVRYVRADFHRVSLREADLVLCYLSPDAMARLQPKLAVELKPSAIVVSSTFALPTWKASRFVVADDIYRTRVYLYHVGICRSDGLGQRVDIVEHESDGDWNYDDRR